MQRFTKKIIASIMALTLIGTSLFSGGCVAQHVDMWGEVDQAVAVLHPTEGNTARGVVHFYQLQEHVKIAGHVTGLEPGSTHAIHVHEFGDGTAPDGSSAGGHYNPEGHKHGLPNKRPRHAGDLGNLTADANGEACFEVTVDNLSVAEMSNPVIGRAVIVHAGKDKGVQPTGDAGPRIAYGVIGVAETTMTQ